MDPAADPSPGASRVARCALPDASLEVPSGAPFVLLASREARVRPAALAAAQARLEREPGLGGVVDLRSREAASSALALCMGPEHVDALLIRAELLRALPVEVAAQDPLARAYWALAAAAAADLVPSAEPLVEGAPAPRPDAEALARYLCAAIRAFAVEDLYPELRAEGGMERFVPCLLDWTSHLLRREAWGPGFALGAYAASIGELRNEGCGPRLAAPPRGERASGDPRVSFIVPTLDRPQLLARALRSLEEQTVQDFEVIVVNDGGRDPAAVLDAFRPRLGGGGRLTVVHHDRNRGLAAARNTGLRLARGRYVGFLDDDDRLLPHHLAALLPALVRGARTAHGDTRSVGEAAVAADAMPSAQSVSLLYRFSYAPVLFQLDNQFPVHSVLCERVLVLECGGFDESLAVLEDWDLWLRVFGVAPPVHVRRVVCEVRTRGDGSRMTEQRARRWPLTMAHIYGKTMQRELLAPRLRELRLRHLLDLCRERSLPFPREAGVWLAGLPGLPAIDPDDPLGFLRAAAS